MSQDCLDAAAFSPDTVDFLKALHMRDVRYVIVGGEAVIYYGYARVTGDIDFFYERTPENARRLYDALRDFWNGPVPGLSDAKELLQSGLVLQFGVPPNRIDLVNDIDGVTFAGAWDGHTSVQVECPEMSLSVRLIGLPALIRNKRASGRHKDLDDLRFLESETS